MQLLPGVVGEGEFNQVGMHSYRQFLSRDWTGQGIIATTVLWIGMNPSTADGISDDRTCRREQKISRKIGYSRYFKGNVLDIRETHPEHIPANLENARTAANIAAIEAMAIQADLIVLAHGQLRPTFRGAVNETYDVLLQSLKPIACFQYNVDGTPTHTIRLLNQNIILNPVNIRDEMPLV